MTTQTGKNFKYEIPECAICLYELKDSIASVGCGHCFHESW